MSRMTNLATIYTTQKNVTTSGIPVQLSDQPIPSGVSLVIKAKSTNAGVITVGNSSANALNSGTSSLRLSAGEFWGFQVENANAIWIDSAVNGEGVEVGFEQS